VSGFLFWAPSLHFQLSEEELAHEEEILRNPFSVKHWMRYIQFLRSDRKATRKRPQRVNLVYERALKQLPGSYKLWHAYLIFRKTQTINKGPRDPIIQVNTQHLITHFIQNAADAYLFTRMAHVKHFLNILWLIIWLFLILNLRVAICNVFV